MRKWSPKALVISACAAGSRLPRQRASRDRLRVVRLPRRLVVRVAARWRRDRIVEQRVRGEVRVVLLGQVEVAPAGGRVPLLCRRRPERRRPGSGAVSCSISALSRCRAPASPAQHPRVTVEEVAHRHELAVGERDARRRADHQRRRGRGRCRPARARRCRTSAAALGPSRRARRRPEARRLARPLPIASAAMRSPSCSAVLAPADRVDVAAGNPRPGEARACADGRPLSAGGPLTRDLLRGSSRRAGRSPSKRYRRSTCRGRSAFAYCMLSAIVSKIAWALRGAGAGDRARGAARGRRAGAAAPCRSHAGSSAAPARIAWMSAASSSWSTLASRGAAAVRRRRGDGVRLPVDRGDRRHRSRRRPAATATGGLGGPRRPGPTGAADGAGAAERPSGASAAGAGTAPRGRGCGPAPDVAPSRRPGRGRAVLRRRISPSSARLRLRGRRRPSRSSALDAPPSSASCRRRGAWWRP